VLCDKDNKATKSQVILIEGLEVVFFFCYKISFAVEEKNVHKKY
jgi:hypothetical protein